MKIRKPKMMKTRPVKIGKAPKLGKMPKVKLKGYK
jgi:hypothetical protein